MIPMKQPPNNADDLLKLAIDRLQRMPIPECPQHNITQPSRNQSRPWRLSLVAFVLGVVAAAIIAAVWMSYQTTQQTNTEKGKMAFVPTAPEVVEVHPRNPAEALDGYITRLDELGQELEQLKQVALLLDARRKADQLALRYGNYEIANTSMTKTQD